MSRPSSASRANARSVFLYEVEQRLQPPFASAWPGILLDIASEGAPELVAIRN